MRRGEERRANPEKLRPRGVGPRTMGRWWEGGRRSVFPWKFGGIPANFVLKWLRSKGSNQLYKIVIYILEGQTLQRWEGRGGEGGFDGRRPKSSNKHKQQQKRRQQQAATGTQATRKAATSSRIKSSTNSTNNNPEKVRAKRCGSRRWGRASSRGISVVFEAFFSGCKQNSQ